MRWGHLSFFLCIIVSALSALAQADPTSTFLFNYGAPAPEEAGLESGRYKSRPEQQQRSEALPLRPVLRAPETLRPAPEVTQEADPAPVENSAPESTVDLDRMDPALDPPAQERVLDFELSTAAQYNSSSSPSWFRRYASPGLSLNFQGNVWLTNEWAFSGSYSQTVGERVSDSYTSTVFVGHAHQEMALGFISKLVASPLSQGELGVYYYERRRTVDHTARMQSAWMTQGALLRVKYSWRNPEPSSAGGYFDFQLYPKAHHRDGLSGGAGLGKHQETYGGKLRLGRSVHLTSGNRLFFGLGAHVEQNRFVGEATAVEPEGFNVKGVYGFHSTVFFEMGLGWSQ